jgi:internalin A
MRSLYLSHNKITDLSPLEGLSKVWSLYLAGNKVADLKPIAKLKWLSSLDLRDTGISDLTALADLTELKFLMLEKNSITDLKVLLEMAKKDAEGDQRFAPFWRIYLADNPLSDAAKTQIEELKKLGARISLERTP